ncbi:Armadillo repeat-containing protein 2 [Chelonia mydas]|uniref:Armadillo repeat-containing protein 2 n=1 Tax=Chelonia mydas TaxID=8469 RepID=M7BLD4_CHEMY|nr:Armadillo repeat-containing protein 2 [Chelonia mydas]
MHSSKNKNVEKPEPFYRPSVPKQKTSAEIINEARNALRTLRTQRPFTPREDQRKLFGSASSRTPENRPPSTFSLHASSFESGESRLVSGTRLSPLDHKPKLLSSPIKDEDSSISFPKPPVDPMEVRKVSSARARLYRTASQGNLISDKIFLPDENKEGVNSEEPATMDDLSRRSNKSCFAELSPHSNFKDDGIPLIYNEHNTAEEQDFLKGAVATSTLQFRSGSCVTLRPCLHYPPDLSIPDHSAIDSGTPPRRETEAESTGEWRLSIPCCEDANDQIKNGDKASSNPSSSGWNKSGSKTGSENDSRVNETEEEENYWNVRIVPIMYELENEENIENLYLACTSLHQALEEGNMFGKRFKRRSALLKILYKLVDIGSDPLGLKLARMILALKVSGKNLLNVCKLVFKISRNEKNDSLIQNDGLLDSLLEILRFEDLQTNSEAFLYCLGAIKFISGNAVLLNELVNKGAVEILVQFMKQINNIKENDTRFSNLGHLLVQVTATLRNLVDLPLSRCQLLCSGAVSELWVVLEQRMNDKDICTNIVRIFRRNKSISERAPRRLRNSSSREVEAKSTRERQRSTCRRPHRQSYLERQWSTVPPFKLPYLSHVLVELQLWASGPSLFENYCFRHMTGLEYVVLKDTIQTVSPAGVTYLRVVQDLVVRVVFILGNLTAKNNQAREQFFKEKGSADTLISLFQTYNELDLNAKKKQHEEEENKSKQKHPSEIEDVLIKLIRVLANLSIHPSVGAVLAANHRIVALLVTVLEYKSIDDCEELVINATATINNLSYYKGRNSVIEHKKLHIAELLLKLLMSSNMDGILEAVRVFGNLSQYSEICDFIIQRKVYKFMIALLDAKHQDVCFSACGVLLNLTVDKNKRAVLKEDGGIKKLVDCLRDFGPTDWQLACLICKTLWNYSENITSPASCFEEEDINTLLVLLASFLDEELALDYDFDRDLRDYHKLYWETEFKPVAQKLFSRIQSPHSFLQPITMTSF